MLKRHTIRFIIIFGVAAIIGIIGIQIYWIKKTYETEENQFRENVMVSLKNVAHDISLAFNFPVIDNPVIQLSSDYYVVNLRTPLDPWILEHFIIEEFKDKNLKTDFEYGIYDCDTDEIIYGGYVDDNFVSAGETIYGIDKNLLFKTDIFLNYFGVRFPDKTKFIVSKMDIFLLSSIITLLFTAFFGYAMAVILRQKRLSEVQRDFVNNMTHEFQTPISTIKIATEVLATPKILNQPDRFQRYVDIIKHENNRLKNQVESVLTTAEIGKGDLSLNLSLHDIHQIISEATDSIQLDVKDRLTLHLNATRPTVTADRMHLINIIRNLVDNARKYSGDESEIVIETKNELNSLYLYVKDFGIGIPKEHLGKIFNKFYRVPTGNVHNVKGFGLGLNYVKEIVKRHKWKIEVESVPSVGTTFLIKIPNN